MPFGFGVGDGIAVANLIASIVKCLRDTGGARSDYQELIRELESLENALNHVDRLKDPAADRIKCAALMCRYPLQEFLRKIEKYEGRIGLHAGSHSVFPRLQWGLGKKGEIAKLRDYMNLHIGSINMQLLTVGLETLTEGLGNMGNDRQEEILQGLEQSRTAIAGLGSSVEGQGLLVRSIKDTMCTLIAMISGGIVTPLRDVLQVVTRIRWVV